MSLEHEILVKAMGQSVCLKTSALTTITMQSLIFAAISATKTQVLMLDLTLIVDKWMGKFTST